METGRSAEVHQTGCPDYRSLPTGLLDDAVAKIREVAQVSILLETVSLMASACGGLGSHGAQVAPNAALDCSREYASRVCSGKSDGQAAAMSREIVEYVQDQPEPGVW